MNESNKYDGVLGPHLKKKIGINYEIKVVIEYGVN